MKSKQLYRSLIILLWFSIFISAQSQDLNKEDDRWYWRTENTYNVKPAGTLKMRDIRGDISVSSWDENKVTINVTHNIKVFTENEAEAILKKLQTNSNITASTVLITGTNLYDKSVYSEYEIRVPAQFNCDLQISGGDLDIEQIDGTINAEVGGGDVALSQITGPLELRLGGGDLEIEACQKDINIQLGGGDCDITNAGGKINAKVGGGDVSITGSEGPLSLELGGGDLEIRKIQKDVRVKVGGGDVEIVDVQGNAHCELGGGSIEIEDVIGTLTAKSSGGDIEVALTNGKKFKFPMELESGMGEINLILPANIKATLDIEIDRIHDYSNEQIESDFPLSMSIKENAGDNNRATGKINGGGPLIHLKTRGGNIYIKKEID